MTRLTTLSDPEAVAHRAARDIATSLRRARTRHTPVHLALSGGSTPARTYELLAHELQDWSGIEVWFVDERCVEPEDEQSNYRLAAQTLIEPAGIRAAHVHRMLGEMGPDVGAGLYALELTTHVRADEQSVPVLDVCVLGIGPDGHVGSLFPDHPCVAMGAEAICLGITDSPKPPPQRITLGMAVLRAAQRCVLLATGPSKADAVTAMLGERTATTPASLLRRERLTVIVDDAASPAQPR